MLHRVNFRIIGQVMASRNLVSIYPDTLRVLSRIRAIHTNNGGPTPTVTWLVNEAVKIHYAPFLQRKTNNTKGTKHANKTV